MFGNLTVGQQFTQTDVSTIDSGDVNSDLGIINDIVINSDSILRNVTTPLLNANGFANFDSVGFVGNKITTRDSNADLVLQPSGTGIIRIPGDVTVENTILHQLQIIVLQVLL